MSESNTLKCEYNPLQGQPKEKNPTIKPKQKVPCFGKRHVQAIILFLCLSISIMVRAQFSVAIVAMTYTNNSVDLDNLRDVDITKHVMNYTTIQVADYNEEKELEKLTAGNKHDDTIIDDVETNVNATKSRRTLYRTYNWSKTVQEMITFSFFVGYTITQVPMGVISQRYGGKLPIMVALITNGVLNFLTPWFALAGWCCVGFSRFLQGFTQGAIYPGIQTMLAKWSPISERGRLCTQVFTGSQFGTILAFATSGLLAGTPTLGWPSSFWLVGILCIFCFVLLATFGAATPDEHPTISKAEKRYITGFDDNKVKEKRTTPWKDILMSLPVWGMVVSHAGSTFCYLLLLAEMPLYLSKVLQFNIKNSGLLSSLPYLAMLSFGIFMGKITDPIINRGYMSITNVRRIANTIGMAGSGVLMIAFAFAENVTLAIMLLILSMALHASVKVGFLVNQIDLSPNFAGTLMSIANLVGNFITLLVPVLVSSIVKDVDNQEQWQIVFGIGGAISILTNIVFIVCIKTDTQPWDSHCVVSEDDPAEITAK